MSTADNDVCHIGGDPEALELFYRRYLPVVRRFVTRRAGDAHAAADLISTTFLAAIDSAHRYTPLKGTPEAWLLGIAYRVVQAERRRQARHWRAVNRAGGRRELAPDAIESLERQIDAERAHAATIHALEGLPEVDRALLELTALEDLSIADAAHALSMQPGAARVRLHRAKKRLRDAHTHASARSIPTGPIEIPETLA